MKLKLTSNQKMFVQITLFLVFVMGMALYIVW